MLSIQGLVGVPEILCGKSFSNGQIHKILVRMAPTSRDSSDEPAHTCILSRAFSSFIHKVWSGGRLRPEIDLYACRIHQ